MDKCLTTIAEAERDGLPLADDLRAIYEDMPPEVRTAVATGTQRETCAAEMLLYGYLRNDGVDPMVAASAAWSFPEPDLFHPAGIAREGPAVLNNYIVEVAKGSKPLEALLATAQSLVTPHPESQGRYETFSMIVEQNS